MAFVVEDGTGVATANSYSAVAAADAYFADRGNVAWVGTNEQKQAWLVQATDYINARFGSSFLGQKQYTEDPAQALEFPRIDIPNVAPGMPANLLKATAEYALRAIGGALAPDVVTDETGLSLQNKREKVGPIETEVSYVAGVRASLLRPYPAADMLLKGLVRSGRGTIRG